MKMLKMTIAAVSMAVAVCSCTQTDDAGKIVQKQRIPEGTEVAFAVANPDGGPFQCLTDQVRANKDRLLNAIFKQSGISEADKAEIENLQKQCGVSANDVKWFVMTVSDIKSGKEVPELDYAYAIRHDIDKILAAVRDLGKRHGHDSLPLEEYSLDGHRAWKVKDVESMEDCPGLEMCFTSLKGQLFLFSTRKAGLKRMVDLYLNGKGESSEWSGFGATPAKPVCLRTMAIGKVIKTAVTDQDELACVDNFVPNGAEMLRNLGAFTLSVHASDDARNALLDMSLATGSDADADALVTLAKTGLMAAKAELKKQAKRNAEMKPLLEVVNALKLVQEGAVARLSVPVALSDISKFLDEAIGALCK